VPVIGKRPPVEWKPYQDSLPTEAELASWSWSQATGVAVVIGPALWARHGFVWCMEIEGRHLAHGAGWLDLEVPQWRSAGLVCESGSGGRHVYCEASAPIKTRFYDWGELRGAGAICVLPPSRHPNGRRYRWLSAVEPIRLDPAGVPGAEERERFDFDEDSGPIGEGGRNDTLFRLGCRLRACGLTADEILATVRVVNRSRCKPPLEDGEVEAIAKQAAGYERGDGFTLLHVHTGANLPNPPNPSRARDGGNVPRPVKHPFRQKPPAFGFVAGKVVAG
jgi:hypothetical protein